MIDSMLQEGTDKALDDQVSRPRPSEPAAPSFNLGGFAASPFRGIGGGVAKTIAFGAEISGAFGQVQGAYGADSAGGMFSTQSAPERKQADEARARVQKDGIDFSNEAGDTFRQRAADILPDPKTAHASEQVVAGLADYATRAVGYSLTLGPLAAPVFGTDVGMEESDRLKQQGVDLATRTKAGAVAGVINAAAMVVPMTGATALTRFGKGVAAGEGAMVGQAVAEREIVRAAGYDKIADSFDPFDPVALALGVVPGVLGARFGAPKQVAKLRSEADVKAAAKLTPEEQAHSDAYERSPANLAELERAIAAEKRPEVRALLEAEHAKQSRAQAEHGVDQAVRAEPDLVAAARVGQVVEAVDAARLTPDADLAGRDAHVSAVEMAHEQMASGEPVEVANIVRALDAPQEAGTVRLYSAGEALDRPVKLSTDLAAVEALARKDGVGVHYVDLPADHPLAVRVSEPGGGVLQPHAALELPRESGHLLRPVLADRPRQAHAAVDQLRVIRAAGENAPREPAPAKPVADPTDVGRTGARGARVSGSDRSAGPQARPSANPGGADSRRVAAGADHPPSAVASAAEAAASLDPDMLVHLDGMDAPMKVGELLAKVQEEARQDTLSGKLLEVAAACDLTA